MNTPYAIYKQATSLLGTHENTEEAMDTAFNWMEIEYEAGNREDGTYWEAVYHFLREMYNEQEWKAGRLTKV